MILTIFISVNVVGALLFLAIGHAALAAGVDQNIVLVSSMSIAVTVAIWLLLWLSQLASRLAGRFYPSK